MDQMVTDGTLVLDSTPAAFIQSTLEKLSTPTKSLLINSALFKELDLMKDQFDEEANFLSSREKIIAGAAIGFSFSAIAGYVLWALRGITLAASAVTALPMWRFFDPLAIVSDPKKKNQNDDDDDDDEKTLKEIIEPK
jgi:hypothetical protein